MTSISTILGLLPLALAAGEGAMAAMGAAVIGGLLISTLLTLFIVPAMYMFISTQRDVEKLTNYQMKIKNEESFKFYIPIPTTIVFLLHCCPSHQSRGVFKDRVGAEFRYQNKAQRATISDRNVLGATPD